MRIHQGYFLFVVLMVLSGCPEPEPFCGDGVVLALNSEECDDGNTTCPDGTNSDNNSDTCIGHGF